MARPSSTYPSERTGKPCGASWPDPLRVTGKIPNVPFGAQYEVTLEPVAALEDMRANPGMLSWRGGHEQRVRQQLDDLIDQVLADAEKFRWRLGSDNYQAVRNLLSLALAELAYVDITHERWENRRFGLEKGVYSYECDRGGVAPGEVYGGGFDRCPTLEELELRTQARNFIVEKFVDACHFIRCAQFGLWRVWLYRSALEEWKTTPQGGGPDGLAPTPPKPKKPPFGAGSFTAQPPGPPPPPVEPPVPPPPPFPTDLGDGLRLPDPGEPEPPDEDDVPGPPEPVPEPVAESMPEPPAEPGPAAPGPSSPIPATGATDAEVIDAGKDVVNTVVAGAVVAKVVTAAVVVGGVVGVTYLVTRNRRGARK